MEIHHGETIEKVVRRHGHSITDLAKLAKVNRRSVYNWFHQAKLRPEIIYKLGCVINHDFSVELPQLFTPEDFEGFKPRSPIVKSTKKNDDEKWKDKYIDLIELYTALLAERNMDRQINDILNSSK